MNAILDNAKQIAINAAMGSLICMVDTVLGGGTPKEMLISGAQGALMGGAFGCLSALGEVFAIVKSLTVALAYKFVVIDGCRLFVESLREGNYAQALERLALSVWGFYSLCSEYGWEIGSSEDVESIAEQSRAVSEFC